MMKLEVKKYVDENYKNINQFAVALGIGYQAACKIYNGETTKIAFDTLEKMCELFNCTPNDLLIMDSLCKAEKLSSDNLQLENNDCSKMARYINPNQGAFHELMKNTASVGHVSFDQYNPLLQISPETQKEIADITNKFSTYLSSLLLNEALKQIKSDDK